MAAMQMQRGFAEDETRKGKRRSELLAAVAAL